MRSRDSFEVVVVGGGTAGVTAALAARHSGARVALVEREPRLGGDCTFYGCVPSKALIEIARVVFQARRLAESGIVDAAPRPGFEQVAARVAQVVEEIAEDERDERFTEAGVELVRGDASFASAHELQAGERTLVGERFVLATGSEPAVPPVDGLDGLDGVPFLTNRTIFSLRELPRRLLVLGGGPIGLELAQAFRRLGSEVAVIELADALLVRDEPEAGELALRVLTEEGVDVRLGAAAQAVRQEDDGEIVVTLPDGELRGDTLLVAAGRRASTEGLRLDRVGVELQQGYVRIDERCRTNVAHVYAAGDVTGGLQFTHVASNEGSVAGRNAAGKRARRERVVPWVTFLDPEIARVGLTEAEARQRHGAVRVGRFSMADSDRARIEGRALGFVKLITVKQPLLGFAGGGRLVGAEIGGPHAGELIQECVLAIRTRAFAGRLAQTIHPYPSLALAVQEAAAGLFPLGKALTKRR